MAQFENPTKNDWILTCLKDLKKLKIYQSIEQIREMELSEFKNLLHTQLESQAHQYLCQMRRKKGRENDYLTIQMSDYLLPNPYITNVEDKRYIFALKNDMLLCRENNFIKKQCVCKKSEETLYHIYNCRYLNDGIKDNTTFSKIYNGNLMDQRNIMNNMKIILKTRNEKI